MRRPSHRCIAVAFAVATTGVAASCAPGAAPAAMPPAPIANAEPPAAIAPLDRAALERVMGRPATALAGGVLRFAMPRTDLRVRVGEVPIRPGFALGSWVAFVSTAHGVVAMGDLVLLDRELGPVLEALQAAGIGQTAIHHHLVGETPHIVYVHIHGHGDERDIAQGVRAALARTTTPSPEAPAPTAMPAAAALDSAAISTVIGRPGALAGGVLSFGTPRPEALIVGGDTMPATMGLATVMNFQATGEGRAAVTGDYVLRPADVDRVIRALQANGITPTSLHNHLMDEEPRLMFLHFWAEGDAVALARGLRAGLDAEESRRR